MQKILQNQTIIENLSDSQNIRKRNRTDEKHEKLTNFDIGVLMAGKNDNKSQESARAKKNKSEQR